MKEEEGRRRGGGERVQVSLSWFRDPFQSGQREFQLFFKANFTSLGLADIGSIALFTGIPYLHMNEGDRLVLMHPPQEQEGILTDNHPERRHRR